MQSQVSGDHLTLKLDQAEAAAELIRTQLKLEPMISDGQLKLTVEEGHSLIPRLVELLPKGSIHSINMTRPDLGDVFLHLTGEQLAEESI